MQNTRGYRSQAANYAQTPKQSNADKRRLDREGCLSNSIVSVGKERGSGALSWHFRVGIMQPRPHEILKSRVNIKKMVYMKLEICGNLILRVRSTTCSFTTGSIRNCACIVY